MRLLLLFMALVFVALMFFFCIGLTVEQNQTEPEPVEQKQYILLDDIRPTHWSQNQWEILDSYLKRIDELEKQVKALEVEQIKLKKVHDAGAFPI